MSQKGNTCNSRCYQVFVRNCRVLKLREILVHAVIAGTDLWWLQSMLLVSPADFLRLFGTVEPRLCSVHTCMQCTASGRNPLA